jgi:iron complex outermembrane receptor protein
VTVRDGSGRSHRERTAGFSAGTIGKISAAWSLAGSITHTARAPSAQELYADGPHAGTGAYEIGDAGLRREQSLGAEIALRRRSGRITGELTLFVNQFEGFIHEQATAQQAVERDGVFVLLDPAQILPEEEPLTVYRYAQTGAKFHGVEFQGTAHLHEGERHQLDLNFSADVTRATDDAGQPLPRIPATRGTVGLEWRSGRWSAGADCQCIAAQRRTAAGESATDGYNLISAHMAWQWVSGRNTWDLFVRGTNLADAEARAHTSFLKEVAPLPGRNLSAGVRWVF